jgi:superfamily II DNA or RNA helicase
MAVTLRPYQLAGADQIRAAFASGKRAPLYVLPTGGGKTVLFSYIAHGAAAKGNRVLTLSHRIELVDQISAALTDADTPHGFIASGYPTALEQTMVASVQTLLKRLKDAPEPQLIIVDEAHHSRAATWTQILTYWPRARLLGVTATPVRTSGEGLGTLFDALIVGPSTAELIAGGFLAPPRVFVPATVDTSGLHSRAGEFVTAESDALMNKPAITGSALAEYVKYADRAPAMIFCVSVEHAKAVARQFREAGHAAMSLDGGTDREVRRGVVADFRAGRIRVLASCDLFSEGFDLPGVHAGILLRPTQSLGLFLQQVGRILRPAPGKTHALILDHVGNTQRFGLPNEPREWSLEGVEKKKNAAAPVKVCPSCFCAMPSRSSECPECGFEFPPAPREVPERDGELEELTPERMAARRERREQGRADTLEALQEIGRRKGHKPGWAQHVWNARQAKRRTA